jgi:hypothetical protein
MSVGNERTTYLKGLEVAELKEEDMPLINFQMLQIKMILLKMLYVIILLFSFF